MYCFTKSVCVNSLNATTTERQYTSRASVFTCVGPHSNSEVVYLCGIAQQCEKVVLEFSLVKCTNMYA